MSGATKPTTTKQTGGGGPGLSVMRSQLGRARGLGAARSGVGHWWAERWTSIALVPLTLWFVVGVIAHAGADRASVAAWLGGPVSATLAAALILTTFHHMHLGLQVVVEDYIHREATRFTLLLLIRAAAALMALACLLAVLRLAVLA